jgi:hypothetical protein
VLTDLRRRVTRLRPGLFWLGLSALTIGVLAAFVASIVFSIHSLPESPADRTGDKAERSEPPKFPASDYRQSRFPKVGGRPLIGVNYTHYRFPNCTFHDTYLLTSYGEPGVARKVHAQLFAMRKAGVATLRTIIWHMTDPSGKDWGPISSAGGRLHEPNRTNLVRYLTEVRRFGFTRLTIAFEPQGTNDPLRRSYDGSKLRENWRFIEAVRYLLKRYGPHDTRIDLFSEGAPNEMPTKYEPLPQQTGRYLSSLYRLYVKRFGNRDVSVSAIASLKPAEPTNRLQNLIRILRSSGEPLPRWYDVHIGFDPSSASYSLRQAAAALDREGQYQPLVIGDAGYDNLGIATAIARSLRGSPRPLEEVSPWYTKTLYGCPVTPPYSPGAYGSELRR